MKKNLKKCGAVLLSLALATGILVSANAAGGGRGGWMSPAQGGAANVTMAESASEIVTGTVTNEAVSLTRDANAETITMSADTNEVEISESGTYIVTGSCDDGNITVKKGTTGVVLVLKDLTLTSTEGAAVSLNKDSVVRVEIEGSVTLTDAEDPADENSTDADTAAAFDGAAIRVKAGAQAVLTGSGTLTVNGNAKNGIKVSGSDSSLIIDGEDLTVNVTAVNDGINASYDLTILGGTVNVSAADDALHADRVLTIGSEGTEGPTVNVTKSAEALEGCVVNIHSGNVTVVSSDDAINAADADGTFAAEMVPSVNITGGTVNIRSGGDGVDSNANVNLTGGSISIQSANNGGEAGIDYDGSLYISDQVSLSNMSGISGPDRMMGGGGMQGFGGQTNDGFGQSYGGQSNDGFGQSYGGQQDGGFGPSGGQRSR